MLAGTTAPNAEPLLFPPERPLEPDELQRLDGRRLESVIQTLAQGLRSYWNAAGELRPDLARVWGLHAGLGQGKSTVVREALRRVQDERGQPVLPRVHGWNWVRLFTQRHGQRRALLVTTIEASQLKAEHLTATLISRLVLPRLVVWALPMAVMSGVVLGYSLWAVMDLLGQGDNFWGQVLALHLAVPALLALPAFALLTSWLKPEHAAGHLEQAIYLMACWTGVAPDLVVLDDLDRASVDQQRAVLRALVRHTRLLRCPLVVCFDETDFLSSDPSPEEPAELLRKLIQVPLRLPPRSREDAVLLAWGAGNLWHQRNPSRQQWASFMLHPVWVGHLARLMLLTESVGPRRAKGLLAEVAAAAESLCAAAGATVVALDDANALLLLAATYQIHPALRRDPELLVDGLDAGGSDAAWQTWASNPRAKTLTKWLGTRPREEAQLKGLLQLADAMMPVASGWRALVFGRAAPVVAPAVQSLGAVGCLQCQQVAVALDSRNDVYAWWQSIGDVLDEVGWGIRGTEDLAPMLSKGPVAQQAAASAQSGHLATAERTADLALMWPLVVASLAQWPEAQRLRCYAEIDRWLGRLVQQGIVFASVLQQRWLLEWVVDPAAPGRWDDGFWADRITGALVSGQPPHQSATAFAVIKALRRGKPTGAVLRQTWRAILDLVAHVNRPALARTLASGGGIDWVLDRPESAQPSQSNPVDRAYQVLELAAMKCWPAVRISDQDGCALDAKCQVLIEHMGAVRLWRSPVSSAQRQAALTLGRRDVLDRPWSLVAWMASHEAQELTLQDWLKVLGPLCHPSPNQADWSFGHWVYFVHHAPAAMGPGAARAWPDFPATVPPKAAFAVGQQAQVLDALDPARWATAFCLLAQGWHAGLSHHERSQVLWPALMACSPTRLDAAFASAALAVWADTPSLVEAELPDPAVRFVELLLDHEQARGLFQLLLRHADVDLTVTRDGIGRCLANWAAAVAPASAKGAEFYGVVREIAKSKLGSDVAPEIFN